MARGEDTGRHPNRQVGRKMKPYGWAGTPTPSDTTMSQLGNDPNMHRVEVGSQKAHFGGYHSVLQTTKNGETSEPWTAVGHETFKTRMGAKRSAKKNVQYRFDSTKEHDPMKDELH